MKVKTLKVGSILSETSFFKVTKVLTNGIIAEDTNGNEIEIGNEYVENILAVADYYTSEEVKTMTELVEICKENRRTAMAVGFYKKDVEKTKKAYNAEVQEAISKVQNAKVSEVEGLLKSLIENPVSKFIPGEFREMKGFNVGSSDVNSDLGRINFVDLTLPSTDAMKGLRQVDTRTIQYIIVGGVKYTLKKK